MRGVNGRLLLQRGKALTERWPWLLPTASFMAGWIGFVLVRRGADAARLIALLALLGWPWLLIEPLIRRPLERRRQGIGKLVVNFVSQSLQQELLFFSLPLLIGATQLDAGQIAFTGFAGAAALVSTIDPLYERWIAARAARRLFFHAYCSWIAALVVLPMVLLLPLEHALPLSLAAVATSLLLTLPMSLRALPNAWQKVGWIAGLVLMPLLLWTARSELPAAGLAVTRARITQSVDNLTPGPAVSRLTVEQLQQGVVAYAAIRAPAGLAQTVVFEWRHAGDVERIVEQLHGGRDDGFRLYSRKRVFPADPSGAWTVDLLTPERQLLKRLRFVVEPAPALPASAAPAVTSAAAPPSAPAEPRAAAPFVESLSVAVAPCLAMPRSVGCADFLVAPLASAAMQCREAGGTPVAAANAAVWAFDADGDARDEYAFDAGDLVTCDGAFSVFDCGSLGCPKILYTQRPSSWQASGELFAAGPDAITLGATVHDGWHDLVVGCSPAGSACAERWTYVWRDGAYERDTVDVRGHAVAFAASIHGLHSLLEPTDALAAPDPSAVSLGRYEAGTEVAVVGTALDVDYYYVSPCNACDSGFVPKAVLRVDALP
jgi:hypothetical protein